MPLLTRRSLVDGLVATGPGLLLPGLRSAALAGDPPRGRTLHVAPAARHGSPDGSGSADSPFATLPAAYARAVAGDTILVRGGTYALAGAGWLLAGHGGTVGRPVRIENYPGERPIIDGAAMTPPSAPRMAWASRRTAGGFPLVLWDTSHLVVRGLTVRNGPMGGLHVNGTHHGLVIEGCVTQDNGWFNDEHGVGLGIYGAGDDNVIRACDSFGNQGGGPTPTGGNADGFQIALHDSTGTVITGNRAWRNADDGFDFFKTSRADDERSVTGYRVEGNWSFENGCSRDGTINATGDGVGFKLGGRRPGDQGLTGGHTVTGCVAWGNKATGFDENGYNGGTRPFRIVNNTSFDNGRNDDRGRGDPGYAFLFTHAAETLLANNVAFATEGRNEILIRQARECHNLRNGRPWNAFSPAVQLDAAAFASLDDAVARGPRRDDGSLPRSGFLRPAPGSCLLGRGCREGLSAATGDAGPLPDLGAFPGHGPG